MKKILLLSFFYFLALSTTVFASDVAGFWKTIDDKTGKPQSIIAIYDYQGKIFGRIIATYTPDGSTIRDTIYNPIDRAPGVRGEPYYSGLDIIWGLNPNRAKYSGGKILDPQKGRVYTAEMWRKGANLIVRGEILIFGQNQTWLPALDNDLPGFKWPDLAAMTPTIPQVK